MFAALVLASLAAPAVPVEPAPRGSHLWVVNELFSNPDGSIQFIEMVECCGSSFETGLGGNSMFSDATGNTYTFPVNLTGDTAFKHLLLGTASFAALPGAPTPDFILPAHFFSVQADTIRWHIYPAATLSFVQGELPLDGVQSLNRGVGSALNSPTNFAGQSGSVVVAPIPTLPTPAYLLLAVVVGGAGLLVLRRRTAATRP